MTAKEALREVVERMSEEDAALWLHRIAPTNGSQESEPAPRTLLEIHEWVQKLSSDIPKEEWAKLPSARDIDKHLYGRP